MRAEGECWSGGLEGQGVRESERGEGEGWIIKRVLVVTFRGATVSRSPCRRGCQPNGFLSLNHSV